jgi:outer membrane receptor protein involved in Fe transport
MPWPGVQSQFISKSGGNNYSGSFYLDYEHETVQSRNIDSEQIGRGAQGGESNRLHRYHDVNADIGGPVQTDRFWWYFSFRDQDALARYANFSVKPHRTRLTNYGGKATYQLGQQDKLIAYAQYGRKHQPTRLDRFLVGPTVAIHDQEQSTWEQLYWGWVWKGEWNHIVNENVFFEIRGGQFGYNWPNHPKGTEPAYDDIGNNRVYGGNRDWARDRRRNQVLGSLSYFKSGWGGNHNFKFGGEIFRETVTDYRYEMHPGDVLHVLRNNAPVEVILFETPSISENGLWTYSGFISDAWQLNDRITLNLGLRFDRYRAFLPEQEHPAGRFNPTPQTFAAVDNVIDWNLVSPRLGGAFDLAGNGKTVVKFNYGQYWWNPGADFLFNVNQNSPDWWKRYVWNDLNGDRLWQPGEQGRLNSSRGGPTESLDPNLEDTYTRELAAWFEREIAANFGVRTGFVYRGIRQKYQRLNGSQPFDAFNVPILIPDPGPDGVRGNADDGSPIPGFNLDPSLLGRVSNIQRNVDSKDDFYSWEITGNRRFSNRWSLLAAFAYTWLRENEDGYFGNTLRQNNDPVTPNDLINTQDGRHHFTTWAFKLHGTYDAPWGLRMTPIVRHQSGQPFGRTFLATLNYGSVRILAEPLGTRRQDNITIVDVRIEKGFELPRARRIAVFLDLFNLLNANPEQNINWSSGTTFLRPLNIVPPRIARFGVKLAW